MKREIPIPAASGGCNAAHISAWHTMYYEGARR